MNPFFDKIFQPKTVAAIGASDKIGSVGYALMQNLLTGGFKGEIYPVNLKHATIQGKKAYPSVKDIPQKIDLAIIATPAKTVLKLVEECGQAGIQGMIIISAGFNEMGAKGKTAFKAILATAKKYHIRIIGPNCLGIINPTIGLNASFANKMPLKGKIALISQSGAICTSILDWSVAQNVGFSHFISVGSMVDVDFADLIDYLGADTNTSCILIYMESLSNARHFMSAARAFARHKPIIVLKAGKSTEGAKAAASHTGAMAGNDAVFDAAFKRAGIIRVNTIAQLFNMAEALAMQKLPKGNRLAIVTNAGGPAVLATDYLMSNGGELATLSKESVAQLNTFLPAHWSHGNPIDILGDATAATYKQTLDICIKDKNVEGILAILTPQSMTNPDAVAEILVDLSKQTPKTILSSWMGEGSVETARTILENGNIPQYSYPESGVEVFLKMVAYSKNIQLLYETPAPIAEDSPIDKETATEFVQNLITKGQTQLTEGQGKQLLSYYGIPVAKNRIALSREQAYDFAEEIGCPVVMKIISPEIAHKTDVGGVRLNITHPTDAAKAYDTILKNVKSHKKDPIIEGVLVEQMISKRYELLIGAKKDPIFGPVIVFGRGGIETELYKDINMALPPLNQVLAKQLIEGTKVAQLLKGFRGMPKVDMVELEGVLIKFAHLLMDFPEIAEIDINPFLMDETGGVAVDAHIILDKKGSNSRPYGHLSIPPYPIAYTKKIQLKNGQPVTLRAIRPEDEPMEAALFECLSKQTVYRRFFSHFNKPNHTTLSRFTNIDYDREIALIAEVTKDGTKKMIGVVRLIGDAYQERAEYAIVVADAWQGQGLGSQLTDFILAIAKERGISTIYGEVLEENKGMLYMLLKRGFKVTSKDLGVEVLELGLIEGALSGL